MWSLWDSFLDIFWCYVHWQSNYESQFAGKHTPFSLPLYPSLPWQSFFVVTMFSVERLQWLVDAVESSIPVLQGKIKPFLESEKAKLHAGAGTTHAATEVCH